MGLKGLFLVFEFFKMSQQFSFLYISVQGFLQSQLQQICWQSIGHFWVLLTRIVFTSEHVSTLGGSPGLVCTVVTWLCTSWIGYHGSNSCWHYVHLHRSQLGLRRCWRNVAVKLNNALNCYFSFSDRVIYARKGDEVVGGATTVENGDKITQEMASVSLPSVIWSGLNLFYA